MPFPTLIPKSLPFFSRCSHGAASLWAPPGFVPVRSGKGGDFCRLSQVFHRASMQDLINPGKISPAGSLSLPVWVGIIPGLEWIFSRKSWNQNHPGVSIGGSFPKDGSEGVALRHLPSGAGIFRASQEHLSESQRGSSELRGGNHRFWGSLTPKTKDLGREKSFHKSSVENKGREHGRQRGDFPVSRGAKKRDGDGSVVKVKS